MTDPSEPTPYPPDGIVAPSRDAVPPFIIDQRPGPGNSVMVTWSLPGLRRLTVRVPWSAWVDGQHLAIGPAATGNLDAMLPNVMPDDADGDVQDAAA